MRSPVGPRLLRLLAMAAYLAEHGRADFDELAERFGLPPSRIARELELATVCEIPPFVGTPLFDMYIDDTGVSAHDIPDFLERPPRLSRAEGFAVLAAGEALLAVDEDNAPLRSALDKLGDALGLDPDAIEVDIEQPPEVDVLQAAVEERQRLEITYFSAWRDELTERCIDPIAVHLADGNWYVEAHDHESEETRKFRVDRIQAITETGETFEPRDPPEELTAFTPGVDARPVRLHLPAEAGWVAEAYPFTDRVDHQDGSFEVSFDVVGTTWLERLLLRVGPEARVLEPADFVDLGPRAADRLLELYG